VIGDRLGAGGMGVVYAAEDTTLRRPVALKFLAAGVAADEEYRARFLREARVAAALSHANTCVVYEVGQVDRTVLAEDGVSVAEPGTPFIAMELVEGETLSSRISRVGRLPVALALDIACQIAEGLAEAHTRQIVHRDLKPHNVMITPAGRVKIVDFGLAKPLTASPRTEGLVSTSEMISADVAAGAVIGTCAYMSPEQTTAKPVDARSDVFSFGVMLYEMVAGALPFSGETATETIAKILESQPPPLPPSAARPKALDRLIGRCLMKQPALRYRDARELLDGLRAIRPVLTSGVAGSGEPASAGEELGGTPTRWRWPALAGAGAALVLVAAYVGGQGATWSDDLLPSMSSGPILAAPPVASPPAVGVVGPGEAMAGQASPQLPRAGDAAAAVREADRDPAESTPSSAPELTTGALSLSSSPRASVTIDGELTGLTPLTLDLEPGTHEILLTGPEGLRWRGRVDMTAGARASIDRDLRATGALSVNSDPWVEIQLDDRQTEQTPIHFSSVAAGLHTLRVIRQGAVTQVLEVFIEEGKTTSVRIPPVGGGS